MRRAVLALHVEADMPEVVNDREVGRQVDFTLGDKLRVRVDCRDDRRLPHQVIADTVRDRDHMLDRGLGLDDSAVGTHGHHQRGRRQELAVFQRLEIQRVTPSPTSGRTTLAALPQGRDHRLQEGKHDTLSSRTAECIGDSLGHSSSDERICLEWTYTLTAHRDRCDGAREN